MLHISLKLTFLKREQKQNDNNIGRFPGGGLGNQNPARTIAHSPPGVKETLNYWLREKVDACYVQEVLPGIFVGASLDQ